MKLEKKGRLSIPRSVLKQVGISTEAPVLVGVTDDGAIIIRPAAAGFLPAMTNHRDC